MTDQKPVETKDQDGRSPYRLRDTFLSTPELALFRVLQSMAGRHYVICPKVALNDIFYIVRPNENVHFFNKFFRKHVDFLLCEPVTLRPAIGIELVKPVGRSETRDVDQFMIDLFLTARLPLVHIPSSEHYLTSGPGAAVAAGDQESEGNRTASRRDQSGLGSDVPHLRPDDGTAD